MKIYEIEEAIRRCIDLETGEVLDAEKLNELQLEKEKKLEGVALWIKEDKAEEKALEEAIKEMQKKLEACRNRIDAKKQWLSFCLEGRKFKTPQVSVYYSSRESVLVDETAVNDLPIEYVKVEKTPRKTEILKALREGKEIEGCTIQTNTSMVIR